jgi:ABC-type molybdate transport system substrate-binding protein
VIRLALAATLAAAITGCRASPGTATADLEVYAAASLKQAMSAVETAY